MIAGFSLRKNERIIGRSGLRILGLKLTQPVRISRNYENIKFSIK